MSEQERMDALAASLERLRAAIDEAQLSIGRIFQSEPDERIREIAHEAAAGVARAQRNAMERSQTGELPSAAFQRLAERLTDNSSE